MEQPNIFSSLPGLRQGHSLSPYLFLLDAKGLSRAINDAKSRRLITWVKVGRSKVLTHLLFIDDVLLFCSGYESEVHIYLDILLLYSKSTRMEINENKSTLYIDGLEVP